MNQMRYRAYPNYKNSGEEWLGAVPSHWKVIQIKHLSPVKRGASPRPIDAPRYFDENGEYAWTRIADVSASDTYLTCASQRLSSLGSSLSVKLQPGELFLSIAGTVGKPCITGIRACIHDGFVYFPELKIPNKFLFYVFAGEQAYKGLGKFGTQLNLNTDTVGGIKIGSAASDELAQIVKFLDHETAKIDRLIEKQEALIRLLKEKRQAVISHAVTKGLNPDAPMKDSGIKWLGRVPAHWSVIPVSYRYEVQLGKMLDTRKITGKNLRTYLRVADVQWGEIRTEDLPEMDFDGQDRERFRLRSGDLLVNEGGSYPGRCAIWNGELEECYYQKALHRMRPLFPETDSSEYFYYVLHWATEQGVFVAGGNEATIEHLPAEKLRAYRFAFPPSNEQAQIVSFLKVKISKLDQVCRHAERQVSILHERRTALISAAVTGKIDVRAWQA